MEEKMKNRLRETVAPLLNWYDKNARILPWRSEPTPYRVWISEIMLQQTRVEAVKPYFERFVSVYPDVSSLAHADLQQVYKLWEGLGYYSRAKNLHLAANMISDSFRGVLPSSYEKLLGLPGIGEYTAAAISSIAYNRKYAVVDGNVLRVVSRLTASREDVTKQQTKKEMKQALEQIMPGARAGDFNQAMMELGALVCLPGTPRCVDCPLVSHCESFKKGITALRPVPKVRPPIENVEAVGMLLLVDGGILLRQRPKKGLWSGFWEVPWVSVEVGDPMALAAAWIQEELKCKAHIEIEAQRVAFSFTRYRVKAWTLHCALDENPLSGGIADPQWQFFQLEELGELTLSSGSRRFLKGILSGLGSRARSNSIVSLMDAPA